MEMPCFYFVQKEIFVFRRSVSVLERERYECVLICFSRVHRFFKAIKKKKDGTVCVRVCVYFCLRPVCGAVLPFSSGIFFSFLFFFGGHLSVGPRSNPVFNTPCRLS